MLWNRGISHSAGPSSPAAGPGSSCDPGACHQKAREVPAVKEALASGRVPSGLTSGAGALRMKSAQGSGMSSASTTVSQRRRSASCRRWRRAGGGGGGARVRAGPPGRRLGRGARRGLLGRRRPPQPREGCRNCAHCPGISCASSTAEARCRSATCARVGWGGARRGGRAVRWTAQPRRLCHAPAPPGPRCTHAASGFRRGPPAQPQGWGRGGTRPPPAAACASSTRPRPRCPPRSRPDAASSSPSHAARQPRLPVQDTRQETTHSSSGGAAAA